MQSAEGTWQQGNRSVPQAWGRNGTMGETWNQSVNIRLLTQAMMHLENEVTHNKIPVGFYSELS